MNLGTIISTIFRTLIYEPLFNLLILIYNIIPGHDLGLVVIILTAIIKVLTWPLNAQSMRAQKAMAKIQPRLKEIQEKYRDNSPEQLRLTSELFKGEKITPFSGFVPILIQLPVLIALYQIFATGLWNGTGHLYDFITKPEIINPWFLGVFDLSKPSAILAGLAGLAQFFQSFLAMPAKTKQAVGTEPKAKMAEMMQKQMTFFFPLLTVMILLKLPSVIGLYWLATSGLAAIQQYFFNKKSKLNPNN